MRLVLALCLAVALPAGALAAGGRSSLKDATATLTTHQIYVDPAAKEMLTKSQSDALAARLARRPGVYVALFPAAAGRELHTSLIAAAAELASSLGRPGLYIVFVGRRHAVYSTFDGQVYCPLSGSVYRHLTAMVDSAISYYKPPPPGGGSPLRIPLIAVFCTAVLVPLLWLAHARRARRGPPPPLPAG